MKNPNLLPSSMSSRLVIAWCVKDNNHICCLAIWFVYDFGMLHMIKVMYVHQIKECVTEFVRISTTNNTGMHPVLKSAVNTLSTRLCIVMNQMMNATSAATCITNATNMTFWTRKLPTFFSAAHKNLEYPQLVYQPTYFRNQKDSNILL